MYKLIKRIKQRIKSLLCMRSPLIEGDKSPKKEVSFRRDLFKTREKTIKEFGEDLDKANKIYYGVLNLIITLSSSFLILTLAVVENFFPRTNGNILLPPLLILSWIFLFLAIIFGIIAELNESIFYSNQARKGGRAIKEMNEKIAAGLRVDVVDVYTDTDYIIYNSIFWAVFSIDSFVLAILFMCLSLLSKIFNSTICGASLAIAFLFIMWVNYYLIRKRKR